MSAREPEYEAVEASQLCNAEKEYPWGTVRCERRMTHLGPHFSMDTPTDQGVVRWGEGIQTNDE